MDLIPLRLKSNCILSDEGLYEHIRLALERGLPLLDEFPPHDRTAVLVGSGPSVKHNLESIRKHAFEGDDLVAVKDAHEWLISNCIVPRYAVAVDPQEHRWNCFTKKHPDVTYLIASQCHPAMFEHLKDCNVLLWHLYIRKGQTYPPNSRLITGGTTTGLRAITLFYTMGYRKFHLYGYDSCLLEGALRFDEAKTDRQKVTVVCAGRTFITTPEMAAQASEFQEIFATVPDIEIESHGYGIITTILEERRKFFGNNSASFVHFGNDSMASYRYRCRIPSAELKIPTNNFGAQVVVFTKPAPEEVAIAEKIQSEGRKVVADFCDDHFDRPEYVTFARVADAITCPTKAMASRIENILLLEHEEGRSTKAQFAHVIPDPSEFPVKEPHCNGSKLLWFGHASNYPSLEHVMSQIDDYPLRIVSNRPDTIQWSMDIMPAEFARADIVIIPATAEYKSANRAVEAIRQGCFVVAEPHPSLNDFPGIWLGNIKEGIEWARQNPQLANERTKLAQAHVESFAPERVASAWRSLFRELACTSDAEGSSGQDGSTSISPEHPISPPTSEPCLSTTGMPM